MELAQKGLRCTICGGTEFEPGPAGRMTADGLPPRCSTCWSLERHRGFRALAERLPRSLLSWRRAIQFAPDGTLESGWFRSLELSAYGGENSIDVRSIPRADASYDFISLSQVLDFVKEDRAAFAEIARIASPTAIVHLVFTSNMQAEESTHYAEPRGTHGRFHEYGRDVIDWLGAPERGFETVVAQARDPVTRVGTPNFFLCRAESDGATIRGALAGSIA